VPAGHATLKVHSPWLIRPGDYIAGFKVERTEKTPGGTRLHLEGGGRILLGRGDHGPDGQGHEIRRLDEDAAAQVKGFQAENPKLTVTDAGHRTVVRHLSEYGRLPEGVRKYLGTKGTAIRFGARPVTELGLEDLAEVQPRGYAPGQTWKNAAAAYSPAKNLMAIGNGTARYASVNMPAHEAGHAVDHFMNGSGHPEFTALFNAADKAFGTRMLPYFTTGGNPSGAASEFFAETFAAWVNTQAPGLDYTPEQVARLIMTAVGDIPEPELSAGQARIGTGLAAYYAKMARLAGDLAKLNPLPVPPKPAKG
jgi:hypothetical protein